MNREETIMTITNEQAIEATKASPHQKVKVAITDIDGVLRGKYINKEKFLSATRSGFGFCNVVFGWDSADVCYDNCAYTGWHTGYPDAETHLDLSTMRKIPWENNIPFFLGDFVDSAGKALLACPRQILKKIETDLQAEGYDSKIGVEFEWFNFKENPASIHEKEFTKLESLTPGMFGYSVLRSSQNHQFFHDIMDKLSLFRVPIEGLHTETGPGVFEAAILCDRALEAADRAVLFKSGVKEIAHRHQIISTFMARWNTDLPGCSGHIHQSLIDIKSNENAFYDANNTHKMSSVFESYLAGLLQVLPEILPMLAPTINSYKRLVEGFWAPTRANWGIDNRTTAFRVIPGSSKSTRLECRVGGSDINPYLGVAACLGAGLHGIRNKMKLTEPAIKGNGYTQTIGTKLPSSLEEASIKMSQSSVAKEIFGSEFVEHLCNSRLWECQEAKAAVTDWELKRYFEII